jgi:hypothetical protein
MNPHHCRGRWLAVLGVFALVMGASNSPADEPDRTARGAKFQALPPEKALRKAHGGGKYQMLLRQIKAPQDAAQYADFRDLGLRQVKEYAGVTDLPKGYWVYVYPYWYIWRDLAATPKPKRAWGPEQATGPPDTPNAGDIQTAWASRTPDGEDEWLLLEYAEPVVPEAVSVHETYNPGALYRVTIFKLDGEEVEVWKGKDPTPVNSGKGVSEIVFQAPFKTNRVRIYLDSKNVPGWNEIDAVGLRDTAGKTHWAVSADASSTYAEQGAAVPAIAPGPVRMAVPINVRGLPAPPPMAAPALPALPVAVPVPNPVAPAPAPKTAQERIKSLEEEVRELRNRIEAKEKELSRLKEGQRKP